MGSNDPPVKARSYDSTRRRERAREQHARTLDAARALFLERGFTGTTVGSIADAADVSPATIFKSYGGKAGLIRVLCEQALQGRGSVAAEDRSDSLRALPEPRQIIEGWGRLVAEVSPRVSPLLLLLSEAARADPEAAALFDELDGRRLERMAENARHLASTGRLRPGVTVAQARDVLWASSAPELYDLLVRRRRWSVRRYSRFVTDMMASALLPDGA
jgi:AcrR family transcriptional regulator